MKVKFKAQSKAKTLLKQTASFLVGAAAGFCNGFFGGGGGLLAVPFLSGVLKTGDKKAHATALAVMLPMTVVSLAVYSKTGAETPQNSGILIAAITIGGALGAAILNKISTVALRFIFNVIMIAAGLKMVFGK